VIGQSRWVDTFSRSATPVDVGSVRGDDVHMMTRGFVGVLVVLAAACAAPVSEQRAAQAGQVEGHGRGATLHEQADRSVSPHPKFASDFRVLVVEALEAPIGQPLAPSLGASYAFSSGERLSRYPIYGSIVVRP